MIVTDPKIRGSATHGIFSPDHLTSVSLLSGVFITKGDVGVGTIVGSAVFNILCIIGVCGIFAVQVNRHRCSVKNFSLVEPKLAR